MVRKKAASSSFGGGGVVDSEEFYRRSFEGEDFLMADYNFRLNSFHLEFKWPFLEDCTCTPEKMAEAGFYCVATQREPDLVRCYWCRRELDGWEPNDDPMAEHARRECPFIKLGKKELTQNDLINLEMEKSLCLADKMKQRNMGELEKTAKEVRDRIEGCKNNNNKRGGGGGKKRKKY